MTQSIAEMSQTIENNALKTATNAGSKAEKNRLNAAEWVKAALDLLAEQGLYAVAVEPLARRLGVTKGSFYWHFENRDALIKATLERFEAKDSEGLEQQTEVSANPIERLRALFRRTSLEMKSHTIYSALLKAMDHPMVQPVMQRVSQKRIHFLMQTYRAAGFSRKDAINRARLCYSAYVGFLQLVMQLKIMHLEPNELDDYITHVIDTLVA